jgi:hypothetical protein
MDTAASVRRAPMFPVRAKAQRRSLDSRQGLPLSLTNERADKRRRP